MIKNKIMCENLSTADDNCLLKTILSDGSRYDPAIAAKINNTFIELATQRDIHKESRLGYACGGPKCCYNYNKFVNTTDCPYYK